MISGSYRSGQLGGISVRWRSAPVFRTLSGLVQLQLPNSSNQLRSIFDPCCCSCCWMRWFLQLAKRAFSESEFALCVNLGGFFVISILLHSITLVCGLWLYGFVGSFRFNQNPILQIKPPLEMGKTGPILLRTKGYFLAVR